MAKVGGGGEGENLRMEGKRGCEGFSAPFFFQVFVLHGYIRERVRRIRMRGKRKEREREGERKESEGKFSVGCASRE